MRPYKFIGHKGAILDLAISPNGNTIASASNDKLIKIWNIKSGSFTSLLYCPLVIDSFELI